LETIEEHKDKPKKKRKTISIHVAMLLPVIMGVSGFCFSVGFGVSNMQASDKIQELTTSFNERLQTILHEYALDEVHGLRSDVERYDAVMKERLEVLEKDLRREIQHLREK
jgi:flagellar biosynthesis protein FliQ